MVKFTIWILLLLLFAISEATAASAARKVVIAHGPVSGSVLPLWIAKEQKFFDKHGLEAQLVVVRGTPILISGLAGVYCGNAPYFTPIGQKSFDLMDIEQ